MSELFKRAGYGTGVFGKWHIGNGQPGSGEHPWERGFDFVMLTSHFNHFDPAIATNGVPIKYKGYRTDIVFDEAMSWMDDQTEPAASVRSGEKSQSATESSSSK